VFFSLEAAKVEMEVVEVLEEEVLTARDEYLEEHSSSQLHHLLADVGALWPKLDHLIYFPILAFLRSTDQGAD
jgi:hypothetical protein